MPITLGDPTSSVPWNIYVLVILWILQFATTAWFVIALGFMALVMTAFGGLGTFLFALPIFLGNLAVLGCIVHEWRLSNAEALTTTRYYRFQVAKSLYFLGILVLIFVPMIKISGFFATTWKLFTFVAPFWGSLWYAYRVRKLDEGFEGEGIRAWW